MRTTLLLLATALLSSCDGSPDNASEVRGSEYSDFNRQLADLYRNKPKGTARAYALMKNGLAGPDWLATIHGYADNKWTCEELIKPYNESSNLSVMGGKYHCQEL